MALTFINSETFDSTPISQQLLPTAAISTVGLHVGGARQIFE